MEILDHNSRERNNSEIDNLIAAAAASGDEPTEDELHGGEPQVVYEEMSDGTRQPFWRPIFLQAEHVAAIQEAARHVLAQSSRNFMPEPYNKNMGSELLYQEMLDLMSFKGDEEETVERIDALRKHSIVLRPSGPQSQAPPLYEQAVNEAASQICSIQPAAIFHKRDLFVLAKMAVRMTGFEFPNSRSNFLSSNTSLPETAIDEYTDEADEASQSLRPSLAAPASASMLLQKSGLLAPRRDSTKPKLSPQELAIIERTAQELAPSLPNLPLKSREQCSLVENFVYTDAVRLMSISLERLDEMKDYIRDVSTIYGRYQSGPRMPSPKLSPYEMGMNEAAACLARLRPTLLTNTLHLIEWAGRVLTMSGLQLSRVPAPSSPPHAGDRWSQRNKQSSGQLRLQSESAFANSSGQIAYSTVEGDYLNEYGQLTSGYVTPGVGGNGSFGMDNSAAAAQIAADLSNNVLDYEYSSGLDSSELIQPLGGLQAIAQLSDFNLEKLGRAQFTVVDPRVDAHFANCHLDLVVEEEDNPLDAAEILRVTGASSLDAVMELSLPCCGYTSINAFDLTRCFNLQSLDLSENALRVFPRRLHLPNLKRLGLTGNRFIHLPLIEQFPKLSRVTVDERSKQLLNPQMLAYFCPHLKLINGQFFDEICSDYTVRIFQEARTVMEPHIRAKCDAEFAERRQAVRSREEHLRVIETMVQQLRDKNFILDESIVAYKNLLAYRFIDEYLRVKLRENGRTEDGEVRVLRATTVDTCYPPIIPMDDEDELLATAAGSTDEQEQLPIAKLAVEEEAVVYEEEEEEQEENVERAIAAEDEEAKEVEARLAGERALFDAADELLGVNFPDLLQQQQALQQQLANGQQQPVQMTLVMDNLGRLHQQQLVPAPGGGYQLIQAPQQQSMLMGQQQSVATANPYQLHLGRSLRRGRSIVMTVVRPSGISGRPVAEFLPGELRNKDYVKGYMASEIYKKAVKDTLGQKSTPRKRPGPGRPRKSEVTATPDKVGTGPASPMMPFTELNADDLGSIKKPLASSLNSQQQQQNALANANQVGGNRAPAQANLKKSDRMMMDAGDGVSGTGLPPRPKKRKPLGMHRSLRDLCAETPYGFIPSYLSNSTGPGSGGLRTDATLIDYDPLHFIRCHAKDNDAGDSETKVWRCLFEPNPLRPEESTHIVATCGGECVCLINCETGKVMKRFKHMEEEFYTIAWTTVEVEGNKRTNILAAAGRMREIRLLHPEQLVCYAEMKGHTEDITAMIFHQTQPTILFSGDSKASVIVWDIGIPSVPDYKTRYQLLMRLRCPRLDVNPVLNLVFLPHYAYLIAGCEDGLFAWKITDLRLEKREREPDMELKLEVDHEVCIDGLAQLSDNSLVIKVVESGEIMVFDFAAVLERRKGLQRVVPIEMRGHLYWQKTDEIYINVSVRGNLGAVLCGDNEGAIWIYDLDPYLDDLHSSSRKQFYVKPIKILEWPECSVQGNRDEDQQLKESITSGFRNPVVNSVEMSSDGHFLAAVTDNNLVCIWRYAPPTAAAVTSPVVNPVSQQKMTVPSSLVSIPATGTTIMTTDEAGNPIESVLLNLPVVDAPQPTPPT